jgi:hypothetical protein
MYGKHPFLPLVRHDERVIGMTFPTTLENLKDHVKKKTSSTYIKNPMGLIPEVSEILPRETLSMIFDLRCLIAAKECNAVSVVAKKSVSSVSISPHHLTNLIEDTNSKTKQINIFKISLQNIAIDRGTSFAPEFEFVRVCRWIGWANIVSNKHMTSLREQ